MDPLWNASRLAEHVVGVLGRSEAVDARHRIMGPQGGDEGNDMSNKRDRTEVCVGPSERVDPVAEGVLLFSNDADDLGFHLPPKSLLTSGRGRGRGQRTVKLSDAAVAAVEAEGEEEVALPGHRDIRGSGSGSGSSGTSCGFGGAAPTFAVSPVVATLGGLWQWRPVRLSCAAAPGGGHRGRNPSTEGDADERRLRRAQQMLFAGSPSRLFTLPFMLCPISGNFSWGTTTGGGRPDGFVRERRRRRRNALQRALTATPFLHPAVVSALLSERHPGRKKQSGGGNPSKSLPPVELASPEEQAEVLRMAASLSPLLKVSLPSALGDVVATVGPHRPPSDPTLPLSSSCRGSVSRPAGRRSGFATSTAAAEEVETLAEALALRERWVQQFFTMTVLGEPCPRGGGEAEQHLGAYPSVFSTSALAEAIHRTKGGGAADPQRLSESLREQFLPSERAARVEELPCHSERGGRAIHRGERDADDGDGDDDDDDVDGGDADTLLPLCCRNLILGGLAELILSIDHYAALVARREFTFSSACCALLRDTKHTETVVSLSGGGSHCQSPLRDGGAVRTAASLSGVFAIERELAAAVASQEALMQLALKKNNTLVGKSSGSTVNLWRSRMCLSFPLTAS